MGKNKRLLGAALLLLALLLLGTAHAQAEGAQLATPATAGRLHVEGTRLTGEDGSPVQLRGISTHGLAWYPQYVNVMTFAQMRYEWNANLVRLAMYTAESGGYCTDGNREQLKRLVRDGVRWATAQDMYVIIDWHILSDNNPNIYLDEAKAFFDEMSAEYAGANNVIYEICNEPNGATTWQDVKSYAEQVIPVIRANDPQAVIIVGTPNWSQLVEQAALSPITGYDNIMYTLHFYAATHKDDLRSRMITAIESGLPVFVTEYGICDASGNGAIDIDEANRWVQTMDQYGVSYAMWNLSNKNESSAMIKDGCQKVCGFTADDLTQSGQWVVSMLAGGVQSAQQGQGGQEQPAQQQAGAGLVTVDCGDFQAVLQLEGSWEENGATAYNYSLTVKNVSGADCASWKLELPFEGNITLSNGWNGNYWAEDSTLRIASVDYNGAIAAGMSVTGIGFIVKGAPVKAD